MMALAPRDRRGFTLIELAIVLVIIGLVVGSVLVGRDLIHVAMLRAQISDLIKYETAVRTFQGKYNALPGDMANATSLIPGVTHNGDGDGKIDNEAGAFR